MSMKDFEAAGARPEGTRLNLKVHVFVCNLSVSRVDTLIAVGDMRLDTSFTGWRGSHLPPMKG